MSAPLALVSCAVGDDAGVGLDHDVGLEPVLATWHGLVRVPGLGVDGGDHPVRGDLAGDPPPAVGAVGALGGFDVLPGDQRQQRHRLGGRGPRSCVGQVRQQPVGVADQGVDQLVAGVAVVPGDRRFPGRR